MMRKLIWLTLVAALAAPAAMAWAGETQAGRAGHDGKAGDPSCCCCCSKTCST
jgi:hypothetical protein